MENVYGKPAYAGIAASMKAQLLQTREALGETDEKFPAIQRVIDANWSVAGESKHQDPNRKP